MFKKLTTAGFILAVTLPAAALAGDKLDADGDGAVSMTEFNEAMPDAGASVFAEIDANADGVLSADELATARDVGMIPADAS